MALKANTVLMVTLRYSTSSVRAVLSQNYIIQPYENTSCPFIALCLCSQCSFCLECFSHPFFVEKFYLSICIWLKYDLFGKCIPDSTTQNYFFPSSVLITYRPGSPLDYALLKGTSLPRRVFPTKSSLAGDAHEIGPGL